jgi:hypothetical protein
VGAVFEADFLAMDGWSCLALNRIEERAAPEQGRALLGNLMGYAPHPAYAGGVAQLWGHPPAPLPQPSQPKRKRKRMTKVGK